MKKKEETTMKRTIKKIALASAMSLSLIAGSLALTSDAQAANNFQFGGMMNGMQATTATLADAAGEIVYGTATNSAAALTADTENASAITVTEENSEVKITESGTYVITGSASSGSITVKKGVTGVVLILQDLDLTSTTGAALSVNKDSEVQIVVSGSVTLTDGENPADETSQDAETADAYDGAALKIKAGASVYLTGDGVLTVNGSAKNGIKTGDEATLVIDGEDLTVDISAANDGINASYDLTILSGTVIISAADDALHADRVLTVGTSDSSTSPTVNVKTSTEGLEGTVVNILSGSVSVNSTDDAINAANSDNAYSEEMAYSINVTGGDVTISSRSDGLDSNGNINLTGGTMTIVSSARNGGDAGMDYDGSLYISSAATVTNPNGVAGPDQMGGGMGRMNQMNGMEGFGKNGRMDQQSSSPDVDGSTQATPGQQNGKQTNQNQTGRNGRGGRDMNQQIISTDGQTAPQDEQSGDDAQPSMELNQQPTDGSQQTMDFNQQPMDIGQQTMPMMPGMNQQGMTQPMGGGFGGFGPGQGMNLGGMGQPGRH